MRYPMWMFKRGDNVELLEAFRDPGDEEFAWVVVGDEEKGRVDISPLVTGLNLPPVYTVQAEWLRPAPQT